MRMGGGWVGAWSPPLEHLLVSHQRGKSLLKSLRLSFTLESDLEPQPRAADYGFEVCELDSLII
jgi:hypothetical protein